MSEVFVASHDSQLMDQLTNLQEHHIVPFERAEQLDTEPDNSVDWPNSRIALFDITENWPDAETLFHNLKKHYEVIVVASENTLEKAEGYLSRGARDFYLKPGHPVLLNKRLKSIANIGDFMRFATHELRNPLVSITGYATLLLDAEDSLEPEQKTAFTQVIQANAERMSHLIDSLRDMALIDSEQLSLNLEPVALGTIINESLTAHHNEIKHKAQQIELMIEDNLPSVLADRRRIHQIIAILLENAVRYTQEAGYILLSAYPVDDGYVTVAVQDSGVGILEEEQPLVFNQRRFRSTEPYVIEQRGNGLSLYIAYQLVQAHDGRIWFESTSGKGSTFYVAIPQA